MFQLGLMSSARYWFTDHLLLMAVFSPIFTTTTTSLSLRCCPRTLPCPACARISVTTFAMTFISTTCRRNYFADLGNGFYGQVYGGYLETMYAGVGSELLYRPLDASWRWVWTLTT